ncbi:MAG: cupin domain-containing protein [Steroidobacteraceae bacterium]
MVTPSVPGIIDFSTATAVEELSGPSPDRLIAGNPVQSVRNLFTDSTGQFFVGTWSSTPGSWRIRYTESEFCHLLSGAIRLTDTQGLSWYFAAGASFIVPAGFTGTWEVLEPARKLYAIFEAKT